VAALAVSGALGVLQMRDATRSVGAIETSDAARRGAFFAEARRVVPNGARVLAITDLLPAPDFDFWFGLRTPTTLLVRVVESRIPKGDGTASLPTRRDLEAGFRNSGILLEPDSLARALATADFVVVADLLDGVPDIPGTERILGDRDRALLRVKRP
jgi:hypothetical protein